MFLTSKIFLEFVPIKILYYLFSCKLDIKIGGVNNLND